jgi:hypothetical protein
VITELGLPFVGSDIVEDLGEYNEDTDTGDTKGDSAYHFDNCRFQETSDSIRRRYDEAVTKVASGQYYDALKPFGSILHTVQDFYAHSNWVDNSEQEGLFAAYNRFEYPSIRPGDPAGSPYGSVAALQQGMPASFSVTRTSNHRLPSVATPWGTVRGLVTGTYENDDGPSACPTNSSLPHGDIEKLLLLSSTFGLDTNTFMTKDPPFVALHEEAVTMAIDATTEEFCRLGRLISLRAGRGAHDAFMSALDVNFSLYQATCGLAVAQATAVANGYLW